jgi:hypothetical protein
LIEQSSEPVLQEVEKIFMSIVKNWVATLKKSAREDYQALAKRTEFLKLLESEIKIDEARRTLQIYVVAKANAEYWCGSNQLANNKARCEENKKLASRKLNPAEQFVMEYDHDSVNFAVHMEMMPFAKAAAKNKCEQLADLPLK